MRHVAGGAVAFAMAACAVPADTDGAGAALAAAGPAPCESLAALALPDTTVTRAEPVPAGAFVSDASLAGMEDRDYSALPAFCRVAATVRPAPDSEIKFEVWLPESGWNGRFVGLGAGGFFGGVVHWDMASVLARGYAVAATNGGHDGGLADGRFFARQEAVIDFAERAVHEMTVKAKAIAAARYGSPARYAYWTSCSAGGRQGLAEAQCYPDDYDGIAAGAAVANWVPLYTWIAHVERAMQSTPTLASPAKLRLLTGAAIAACDADDGVVDRIVGDPRRCAFDPGMLACTDGASANCLTPAELEAARSLYRGPVNPGAGEQIYPGGLPTGEAMWLVYAVAPLATEYFRHAVMNDPDWQVAQFDYDRDVARAREVDAGLMSPRDPDLGAFAASGGKLILWHGFADGSVSPLDSISYYDSVVDGLGAEAADDVASLFLLPGVAHCGGGEGPDEVDWLGALEAWVERGAAPERLIASGALADGAMRTRPLCPYPQIARYDGVGSSDLEENFRCAAPPAQ